MFSRLLTRTHTQNQTKTHNKDKNITLIFCFSFTSNPIRLVDTCLCRIDQCDTQTCAININEIIFISISLKEYTKWLCVCICCVVLLINSVAMQKTEERKKPISKTCYSQFIKGKKLDWLDSSIFVCIRILNNCALRSLSICMISKIILFVYLFMSKFWLFLTFKRMSDTYLYEKFTYSTIFSRQKSSQINSSGLWNEKKATTTTA